jgi:hypothetical protein
MNTNNSIPSTLLNLITKEQLLKTKLNLYETINNEYVTASKDITTPEKKARFNVLLNNLLALKQENYALAEEIISMRGNLTVFDDKINNEKQLSDKNLLGIMKMLEEQNKELMKNKQSIDDFNASGEEFSKIYTSQNIKYMFLILIVIVLIVNIITSIAVPYKTNLEKTILGILSLVGTYYLHQLIIKRLL